MVNVPHTFISSLIESESPLDVIWEYLQKKIWEPETDIVSYFNKNEKKASDFERFIRDVYFEVYDEIVNEAMKGRPKLKEMMEEADECHKELVSIADQSQEHHGSFIEYAEQLKGARGRHIWLQNRIKSHKTAVDYWEGKQREMAAGGDKSD